MAGWLVIQIATQVFPFFEIPNWSVRLVLLVVALGWLGDRAAVGRESETLLRREAPDRWQLPRSQVAVASAYAILRDADHAVPLPAAALASPRDITPTPALLRIDPIWDNIRDDPRFQKLCADGKL